MKCLLVVGLLAAGLAGCKECEPDAFRCTRTDVLQICDADGRWRYHTDCAEIYSPSSATPWVCCGETDAGPECVPEDECAE